jgi:VWFA-related protein
MLKVALAIAFSIAAGTAAVLASQDAAQQPTPVFRASINLVHFAVSVLDRHRHPVTGLTADDFTVFEDGNPQRIAAFAAVEVPTRESSPQARWAAEVSPDIQNNERRQDGPEGRLVVLLLDDALLPGDPAAVQNARRIARGVLDRLSPVDKVAVVFTLASRNAQDFTTDRRALVAAIDSLRAGPSVHLLGWDAAVPRDPRQPRSPLVPAIDMDSLLRSGTVRTLQSIADALVAAPQMRKILVFVSLAWRPTP